MPEEVESDEFSGQRAGFYVSPVKMGGGYDPLQVSGVLRGDYRGGGFGREKKEE
ncbi:MAG: hypothetical protein GX457_12490 [Thermotogaceae bacterium]|nr:hypothetical protein [Thermotogaceae bacterium]